MAGSTRCGGVILGLVFLLIGCSGGDARQHAEGIAYHAGLVKEEIATDGFLLRSWQRISPSATRLHVYIEGDGFAWAGRTRPSNDPTPHNPVGLMLAAADPFPDVLYLARPCQFTGPPLPERCSISWWTDRRFNPELINVINDSLSEITHRYPGIHIDLTGYSGGATIAAQLAAMRSDVVSLRTVAGNLDVAFVNAQHRVTAMPEAASAMDVAARLSALPQVHFSGAEDKTVTPEVANRFREATGERCAEVVVVPQMGHGSDWAALWPVLLKKTPRCR